ncbi:MAG: hypothetical protein LBK57_05450 [Clostridiales Family XIII bacterium]|jgi:hypothetical protein|nr:hypothetical protein [Clostridiales Family XIII bacterium]
MEAIDTDNYDIVRCFQDDEIHRFKVFERLRAPHKELIVLNTGEHMLMVTHPREVCDAISAKMREVLKRDNHGISD